MNKPIWLVLLGVMGGLLAAGALFLVARTPVGEAVELLPPPTTPPLVVYVTGAVCVPGVYHLPPGSRVEDALAAAGGLTAQANPESLNLAQVVTDGQRVQVPEQPAETAPEILSEPITRGVEPVSVLVNINTADQAELESLPEIGPHLASEIIAYREANGPFETVDELMDVTGIGTVILETIRELITVEEQP
jgi:competence protein ComEA